jgi:hypothetical protein
MKIYAKVALSALLLAGATALSATPASAQVSSGISFGYGDDGYTTFSDPCDYYDYYNEPPPWGLPPDYCDYPVYFEPVYYGGNWYRGPIYYRWYGGDRLFWLNGGWRRDGWRGGRPNIRWQDRGGWGHRGNWSGGGSDRNRGGYDRNRGGYERDRSYDSGGGHWSGGGNNWRDGGHSNWSGGSSGGHGWSGGGGWSGGYGGGGGGYSGGGGHGGSGYGGGGHGGYGGHGGGGHGGHGDGSGHHH